MKQTRSLQSALSRLALATVVVAASAGCSSMREKEDADKEANARQLIATKIAVAADAQREYAAILNEDIDSRLRKQASLETDIVDVDFIGPPVELLMTMAHRYGYKFVESGPRRNLTSINVRVSSYPPVEVLRDIGNQLHKSATVQLDMERGIVRLIYRPESGNRDGQNGG